MKKNILISLSLILGAIIFFAVLSKVGWNEVWRIANILSWKQLLLVMSVAATGFIFSCFCDRTILKSATKKKIPFIKVIRAGVVGFALSYLTPSAYIGGEPFKAFLIKEEIGVDSKTSIAAVVIEKVFHITADIFFAVVGAIYLLIYFHLPEWLIWVLAGILCFCLGAAFFFFYRAYHNKGFLVPVINFFGFGKDSRFKEITGHIQEVEDSISVFFTRHSKYVVLAAFFSLMSRCLNLFSIWLVILFLGVKVGFIQIFGFYALTVVVYLIPIPGALGIHEISQALIFGIFGLKSSAGIALSLIYRLINLCGAFIGLMILLHFQLKKWKEKIMEFLGKIGKWLTSEEK